MEVAGQDSPPTVPKIAVISSLRWKFAIAKIARFQCTQLLDSDLEEGKAPKHDLRPKKVSSAQISESFHPEDLSSKTFKILKIF